mmetsp:Transcript_26996/g.39773  ORF Transcript_26996/g.39773 Transcript_26996/m.39773 type:complete len:306 (+) Transcript_26996:371-1288(+)
MYWGVVLVSVVDGSQVMMIVMMMIVRMIPLLLLPRMLPQPKKDGNAKNKISDAMSNSLRERSILQACEDVRMSLMNCAGIAAVYGVGALALGVAGGVDAAADMAGGPVEKCADTTLNDNNTTSSTEATHTKPTSYLPIPPLSIVLQQEMIETQVQASSNSNTNSITAATTNNNGSSSNNGDLNNDEETRTIHLLQREQFALSGSVTDGAMTIHCFDIVTQISSPLSFPNRIACSHVPLLPAEKEHMVVSSESINGEEEGARATKRARLDSSYLPDNKQAASKKQKRQMIEEVQDLAARFYRTLYC